MASNWNFNPALIERLILYDTGELLFLLYLTKATMYLNFACSVPRLNPVLDQLFWLIYFVDLQTPAEQSWKSVLKYTTVATSHYPSLLAVIILP